MFKIPVLLKNIPFTIIFYSTVLLSLQVKTKSGLIDINDMTHYTGLESMSSLPHFDECSSA